MDIGCKCPIPAATQPGASRVLFNGRQNQVVQLDSAVEWLVAPGLGIAGLVLERKFVSVQRVVAAESGMLPACGIEFVDGEPRRQRIAQHAAVREEPPVHFREAPQVVESEVKAVERRRLQ